MKKTGEKIGDIARKAGFVFGLFFGLSALSATFWFVHWLLYCGVPGGPFGISRWWDAAAQPIAVGLSCVFSCITSKLKLSKTLTYGFQFVAIVMSFVGVFFGFALTLIVVPPIFVIVLALEFYFVYFELFFGEEFFNLLCGSKDDPK